MTSEHTTAPGTMSDDELHADIDTTRADLGDTVAALADKADVTGHAKASAQHTAAQVRDAAEQTAVTARESVRRQPARWAAVAVGVAATAAVGVLAWRRRTRPAPSRRAARAWHIAAGRLPRR